MKCSGIDALGSSLLEISFGASVESVTAIPTGPNRPLYLAPGWIDLQVNGFAGVDYNLPSVSHEDIGKSIRALFATGVTRFYPTVITGALAEMEAALANLALARERLPKTEREAIAGFHVEGPHISPEDGPRGAHPRRWVRPPDPDEFRRLQDAAHGLIRLVTLAPEWPEAPRYIELLVREGVVAALGHTNSTSEQIAAAVSAGATVSTHLGNAAARTMPRFGNVILEQLAEDRLTAGFIADGIHLPPAFLKVALRAKGSGRAFLVTDAAAPAGCSPGRYTLGEQDVELTPDQRIVLAGQTRLAGSALHMDRAIENVMKIAGLSLPQAVEMATTSPARAGRVQGRQMGLAVEEKADLVQFRFDPERIRIQIEKTYLSGELVYSVE